MATSVSVPSCRRAAGRGFTLIELMITVVILALLTAIAVPSYSAYVQRSRVPAALDALSTFYTRMEQRYQDVSPNTYANAAGTGCAVAVPGGVSNFTITCTLANAGQSFTATATGSGPMAGYSYSINDQGTRTTVSHPKGVPTGTCWSLKGGACDS